MIFGLDPPAPPPLPPNPPSSAPIWTKGVPNCSFFQIGIHLHTHQDLKLKCCRITGQKLRYSCPCTHDLPGTHNWLAQSHIASIPSEFHNYIMLAQSCQFGVICCFIGLTRPAACTRACASDFWTCPTSPPP